MNHSAYYLAKQAEKGAISRAAVEDYLHTAAESVPALTERARKRISARAQKLAKERVDIFGYAVLSYTNRYIHLRDEVRPTPTALADIITDGNPLQLLACFMADIGISLARDAKTVADPLCRNEIKQRLIRSLRQLRRPFYYARETERRRSLAQERRKIRQRRTSAPMPDPSAVLAAWESRKTSKAAILRLGALLVDLSCHVDSCLRFDEDGNVIGRNGGVRGWLKEFLPELLPKYKTLMRYKEMAEKLRQATDTRDPAPTSVLFEKPHPVVAEILAADGNSFASVLRTLSVYLDPDKALDIPLRQTHDPFQEKHPQTVRPLRFQKPRKRVPPTDI